MRPRLLVLLALGLFALPATASANAGTPLLWATMLHLVVGNFLIGMGEGWFLARLYGLPLMRTMTMMAAANYFSAWVGLFTLGALRYWLAPTVATAMLVFWGLLVVAYGLTLVLEWPFVARCVRPHPDWWRRSLRGSLCVQTASYVVLTGWYLLASPMSFYTSTHLVTPGEMVLPESIVLFYVDGGVIYERLLRGGATVAVVDLNRSPNAELYLKRSAVGVTTWDLYISGDDAPLHSGLTLSEVHSKLLTEDGRMLRVKLKQFGGPAARLGTAESSPWVVGADFFAEGGLGGGRQDKREHFRIAYATPFGSWRIRNVTLLPGDLVLFQAGEHDICVFDPVSRKLAVAARGECPLPVLLPDGAN